MDDSLLAHCTATGRSSVGCVYTSVVAAKVHQTRAVLLQGLTVRRTQRHIIENKAMEGNIASFVISKIKNECLVLVLQVCSDVLMKLAPAPLLHSCDDMLPNLPLPALDDTID